MNTLLNSFTILLLAAALFLTGCGSSSYRSVSGSAGYGVYHGYNYSPYRGYNSYYNDDVYVRVDRDKAQERKDRRVENKPKRQQNAQAARSRASSMGRPSRAGGGGGRRR